MLDEIRSKVKGPWAIPIVVIVSIPFIMFGVESIFSIGSNGSGAVSVNGEDFSEQYIERLVEQQVQSGEAESSAVRQKVIEEVVERTLLEQAADKMGLHLPNSVVTQRIATDAQFMQNGKFSQALFDSFTRQNGISGQTYIDYLRTDLALNQVVTIFSGAEFVTPAEIEGNIALFQQTRDATIYHLPIAAQMKKIAVSDDELQQFYEENKTAFLTQEQVSLEYLELDSKNIKVDVSEEDIQTRYQAELASLRKQRQVRVSHIMLLSDTETADEKVAQLQALRQRILAGEDFATIAKQNSQDVGSQATGGDLGFVQAANFPPEFAQAVEQLQEGELSEPVVTDAGVHLIKATEVKTAAIPALAESRERIKQELESSQANVLLQDQLEKLVDISFTADNLAEPAQALGLDIKTTQVFSRLTGEGDIATNKDVIAAAFSGDVLEQGNNSDAIQLAEGRYVVVRLKEHFPARQKTYAQVTTEVSNMVKRNKALTALQELEQELVDVLHSGQSIDKLNQSSAINVSSIKDLKLTDQRSDVPTLVSRAVFEAPRPAPGKLSIEDVNVGDDYYVVAVSDVRLGAKEKSTEQEVFITKSTVQQFISINSQQAFKQYLKNNAKIRIRQEAEDES